MRYETPFTRSVVTHALSVGIPCRRIAINDIIYERLEARNLVGWQFAGNSRGTGANICVGGCLTVPVTTTKTIPPKPIQSCLRSSTPLNRTPGNPTCHVATVPQKMIGSIVLALLLFCQSINADRCLRANGTHDEISQAVQQPRPRRSLTFPKSSMLLVCNWLIDEIASLIEFDMLNC